MNRYEGEFDSFADFVDGTIVGQEQTAEAQAAKAAHQVEQAREWNEDNQWLFDGLRAHNHDLGFGRLVDAKLADLSRLPGYTDIDVDRRMFGWIPDSSLETIRDTQVPRLRALHVNTLLLRFGKKVPYGNIPSLFAEVAAAVQTDTGVEFYWLAGSSEEARDPIRQVYELAATLGSGLSTFRLTESGFDMSIELCRRLIKEAEDRAFYVSLGRGMLAQVKAIDVAVDSEQDQQGTSKKEDILAERIASLQAKIAKAQAAKKAARAALDKRLIDNPIQSASRGATRSLEELLLRSEPQKLSLRRSLRPLITCNRVVDSYALAGELDKFMQTNWVVQKLIA